MHKLNVAYANAFGFMHHLPTYCSASLMFVVNRVVSFSNVPVLSAVTSDARYRSVIVRHWLKLLYVQFLMVVEIACAVIVDQLSNLVSCVVIIIMLVSGYIAQLYNAILCVLWA